MDTTDAGIIGRLLKRKAEAGAAEARSVRSKKSSDVDASRDSLLQSVLAASVDHIYVVGKNGKYIAMSDGAAAVLGYTPEETVGKTWKELGLAPDVMKVFDEHRDEVLKTGKHGKFETYYDTPDGILWFEYVITPVKQGNEYDAVIVVSRDITERKRAEQEAMIMHERFKSLSVSSPIGVFQTDIEGRCLYTNARWQQITGLSAEESLGDGWADAIHPDDYQTVLQEWTAATREKREFSLEFRFTRPDGEMRWVHARAAPLFAPTGELTGFVGTDEDITDRKAAEARLSRSEERYRAFIKQSSEGIWRFELDEPVSPDLPEDEQIASFYRLAYLAECNDAMAKMYGFEKASDLEGVRLPQMLLQDDPHNIETFRTFIRSGYKLTDAESHEVDKEGRSKYFLNNFVGILENGMLVRAWGMQRDITATREAEEAMRESEERLRLALDAGKIGAWDWDVMSNRITWSPRVYEFHGVDEGNFHGTIQEFQNLIHPDDRDMVRQAIEKAMREGPYQTELRIVRPSGEVRWLTTSGRVLFDVEGKPVRMLGATSDITEQKLAGAALQKSEMQFRLLARELEHKVEERTQELRSALEQGQANIHRLKAIMAHLPMAAIALDESNTILEVNQVFCDLFGIEKTPEEMTGMSAYDFIDNFRRALVDFDKRLAAIGDVIKRGEPSLGVEAPMQDGRILLRDFIPISENGKPRGHLFLYRDVTQERRIDATKSEFMSLASHQLRTPLTAIRWTFGRLGRSLGDRAHAHERSLIKEGKVAAARMAETIDTMLAISRIEAGKLEPQHQQVSVVDLLHDVLEQYREDAEHKQVAVLLECEPGLSVLSDHSFLKEIVSALVENAIRYTPAAGSVTVRAARLPAGGARIEVEDTGYGIPQHQQEKIFRKFFRGENVVSKVTEGSGLGLYLVSLMTGLLHASVTFVSKEGEGSTFKVDLPG